MISRRATFVISIIMGFISAGFGYGYGVFSEHIDSALQYACGYVAGQSSILAAQGGKKDEEHAYCVNWRRNAARLGFDPSAQGDK